MERKVVKFRKLKNEPPTKLPVLLDQPARAMSARKFAMLVVLMALLSFVAATAIASGGGNFFRLTSPSVSMAAFNEE